MDSTQNTDNYKINFIPSIQLDVIKKENELLLIRIEELLKNIEFLQKIITIKI